MWWVSWPLFIFVFLALFLASGGQIFGRKWGFRNILKKNYRLNSFFSWRIPTCVAHDCKIEIFIWYFWVTVVITAGVYCPQLWAHVSYLQPEGVTSCIVNVIESCVIIFPIYCVVIRFYLYIPIFFVHCSILPTSLLSDMCFTILCVMICCMYLFYTVHCQQWRK